MVHSVNHKEPAGLSRTISVQWPGRFRMGFLGDHFDLNLLAVKATPERTVLASLEVFEATLVANFSDDDLLKFIIGRLDPEASRSGIAALQCVRMTFHRRRQRDITADVEHHAKAAGIDFKLELIYQPDPHENPLSTSSGIKVDGRSWDLPDIDEASVLAL
ncbi:hypothetical protein BDZ97DRAFT_1758952 [Flammula alnicola]|nr:hypothetical protein BDZ97DRAFT_1758952 [Flammula alnicola]